MRWWPCRPGRSPPPALPPSDTSHTDAVANAWQIHTALVNWTTSVDTKTSIALAIESAVLGGVVALTAGQSAALGWTERWQVGLYWSGLGLLALGALIAVSVIMPRLRSSKTKQEAPENFVFFGHLQHWAPSNVERALLDSDVLPVLSRQLVVMSQIAWGKHKRLQWSMTSAVTGTVLVAVARVVQVLT